MGVSIPALEKLPKGVFLKQHQACSVCIFKVRLQGKALQKPPSNRWSKSMPDPTNIWNEMTWNLCCPLCMNKSQPSIPACKGHVCQGWAGTIFCLLPGLWEQNQPFLLEFSQLPIRQAGLPWVVRTSYWPKLQHLHLSGESLYWSIRPGLWSVLKPHQPTSITAASRCLRRKGRDASGSWCSMFSVVEGISTIPHHHPQ